MTVIRLSYFDVDLHTMYHTISVSKLPEVFESVGILVRDGNSTLKWSLKNPQLSISGSLICPVIFESSIGELK